MDISQQRGNGYWHPVYVHYSENGRYATLLGWAKSPEAAKIYAQQFEASEPVDVSEFFA